MESVTAIVWVRLRIHLQHMSASMPLKSYLKTLFTRLISSFGSACHRTHETGLHLLRALYPWNIEIQAHQIQIVAPTSLADCLNRIADRDRCGRSMHTNCTG